ncbi:hypothetical protein ABFX02_12G164300 [Erythranthe guttata]|uniref:uncharacterized protein LOC105956851 n=1 Tax=Erythranthe guttata TaxID=4155 RepID=UPI00064E072C|nr:PREDICTED: uncharacterized protein LOC105956851 [Erythranthe guttata]|eukprot:XP_012836214.1 PREDICTED: uncharacterized protein LOC105956851 [Erythranthe guttata]
MQLLHWQSKGTENWRKCSFCRQHHFDDCAQLFPERRRCDDDLCLLNQTKNYSQLSSSSTMSRNFTPTFVYQRKRQRKNPDAIFTVHSSDGTTKPSNGSHSAISSEQEHVVPSSEEAGSEEALTTNVDGVLTACSADDNCSSSKSNLELSLPSLNIDIDDSGECSSSGALNAEKVPEELSERDACISILRNQGLLDRIWTRQNQASTESNYCSKQCKICKRVGSTLKMLICDNCEDAFHVFCYNPRMTILPVGEWLCNSCSKKKHKILKDKSAGSSASEGGDLGSLEIMFRDTEPYMSNVRIGDEFQSDVPNWCGPIHEECDHIADLIETDGCNNFSTEERGSLKSLRLSSIGNWLQCREVIEGIGESVDGTVCGKWRRAPLFEVQTDKWECYRCILWDPAHADCAVPQEIDTEEVMKQLKYIEMLRPRLAAKKRKSDCLKSNGSSSL